MNCFPSRILWGKANQFDMSSLYCKGPNCGLFCDYDPCSQKPVNSLLADAQKLFEQDIGALNRRTEKTSLLSNLGPYCKALCARRDFAIRRQLLKNDKVDVRIVISSAA